MTEIAWLTQTCAQLIADLLDAGGVSTQHRQRARAVGARAAAASLPLQDVIGTVLTAAAAAWADGGPGSGDAAALHTRAGQFLNQTQVLVICVLDGYQAAAHLELSRHDDERAAFVDQLLSAHADPATLAARANRYGLRLSGEHTVAVARAETADHALAHHIDQALAERFGAGNTLTTLREGQLICISAGGLRGVTAELAHRLLARLGADAWQIGVGRTHRGLAGIAASLDEARNALDLADRLGFRTPVLHAADLLVFPVLLRDRDAITDLVTTVLGPLAGARGGAQPLLDTLSVLFDNQGNHTATARQLHISVRAVAYRLDRVQALTGYHPGEPTQRFTLHTAVLGARLLGWPDTQPG